MSQPTRGDRYAAELLDADGDVLKRFYARNLRDVKTELAAVPQAVAAKTNELRTGQARVIRA